jgi:hypothetical protein
MKLRRRRHTLTRGAEYAGHGIDRWRPDANYDTTNVGVRNAFAGVLREAAQICRHGSDLMGTWRSAVLPFTPCSLGSTAGSCGPS